MVQAANKRLVTEAAQAVTKTATLATAATDAQTRATAAQTAAATDATTKANSAQAGAASDATAKANAAQAAAATDATTKVATSTSATAVLLAGKADLSGGKLAAGQFPAAVSAELLTDGSTKKAFLATERTQLASLVSSGGTTNASDLVSGTLAPARMSTIYGAIVPYTLTSRPALPTGAVCLIIGGSTPVSWGITGDFQVMTPA